MDFPEPFQRFEYDKYIIKMGRKKFEIAELDYNVIKDFFIETFQKKLSIKDLRKVKMEAVYSNGFLKNFNEKQLRKLIGYEINIDGVHYIRFNGKWLKVLDNLLSFLNEKISEVGIDDQYLPSWDEKKFNKIKHRFKSRYDKKIYDELLYNRHLSKQLGFRLLDRNLIHLGGNSKIELADLYDDNSNSFIHVKKASGAKASYLFSQALVSSELYSNSKEFKEECYNKFNISSKNSKRVVIAIAMESNKLVGFPMNLPYFAKINLYTAISNIRKHGYKVILAPITII